MILTEDVVRLVRLGYNKCDVLRAAVTANADDQHAPVPRPG